MSMLTVDRWASVPGLVHGFLSCPSPGPNPRPAEWSAELEAHGLPPLPLILPRQVHGTRICAVACLPSFPPEADGLLTTTAGVAVGITTADCVPVLLIAPATRLAAAVHAGWRGVVAGIIPEAVSAAVTHAATPPAELRVAIGPAIGPCCYQVGLEVRAAFEKRYGWSLVAPAFAADGTQCRLDLRLFVGRQLRAAGIPPSEIQVLGPCTSCDRAYASYRRDGPPAGRQLSFVGWL
jgi:YfiH family protein